MDCRLSLIGLRQREGLIEAFQIRDQLGSALIGNDVFDLSVPRPPLGDLDGVRGQAGCGIGFEFVEEGS